MSSSVSSKQDRLAYFEPVDLLKPGLQIRANKASPATRPRFSTKQAARKSQNLTKTGRRNRCRTHDADTHAITVEIRKTSVRTRIRNGVFLAEPVVRFNDTINDRNFFY